MDNKPCYEISSNSSYGSESSGDNPKKLRTKCVHYTREFPPGCGPNVLGTGQAESSKESNNGMGFFWRRSVGAVKGKCDEVIVMKKETSSKHEESREKILELLNLFREKCVTILRKEGCVKRVDCRAKNELENEGKIINGLPPIMGEIPGVKIGDKFEYRVELVLVRIHRRYEHGIDHMWHGDKIIATCIVATEGHMDKMDNPNVLIYRGEGGKSRYNKTGIPRDQKLKGGNLASWNSMEVKNSVRVVKGFKKNVYDRNLNYSVSRIRYVYDGLYEVMDCEVMKGLLGNLLFEFKLLRCHGQPNVSLNEQCKRARF